MANEVNFFSFFRSYHTALKKMPIEDRHALCDAILDYVFDGVTPQLEGVAAIVFDVIEPNLSKSINRSEAGKKGGKSNAKKQKESKNKDDEERKTSKNNFATNEKTSKKEFDVNNISSKPEANPSEEKEKEKEKEKEMDKENTPPIPPSGVGVGSLSESPPDPFEEFWDAYPRKVGKEAARKAWKKIRPNQSLQRRILDAVEAAKQSKEWQKDNGQYIPHPATWLNQGRWDDELTPYEPEPPRWQPPNYDDEDDFIALLEREKAKEKTKDG